MENYRVIATQSYDTIGKEIGFQMELNPGVREIRLVKIEGARLMYDSYALEGIDPPAVDSSYFIDAAPSKELEDLLNNRLIKGRLPQEVRVIRPNHERDSWGIFFKP